MRTTKSGGLAAADGRRIRLAGDFVALNEAAAHRRGL